MGRGAEGALLKRRRRAIGSSIFNSAPRSALSSEATLAEALCADTFERSTSATLAEAKPTLSSAAGATLAEAKPTLSSAAGATLFSVFFSFGTGNFKKLLYMIY